MISCVPYKNTPIPFYVYVKAPRTFTEGQKEKSAEAERQKREQDITMEKVVHKLKVPGKTVVNEEVISL